jgi:hypothetical protein
MGVGRLSILLRGVGVLAMPDAGLDTKRPIESVLWFRWVLQVYDCLYPACWLE